MPRRKHTIYVVEHKNGEKEFYKTKKEICDVYGVGLSVINHALFGFPICLDGETTTWIHYFTCKDCADYMLESKNCYKTKNCLHYEKNKKKC